MNVEEVIPIDARVRYTMQAIESALVKLLRTHPLAKITVKQLCEEAEINRATFYRYYDNVFDLMDSIKKRMTDSMFDTLDMRPMALRETFLLLLDNIEKEGDKCLILFSENGDASFPSSLLALAYEYSEGTMLGLYSDLSPSQRGWLYQYIAHGCSAVWMKWLEGGMRESKEYVADFMIKLVTSGLSAFGTYEERLHIDPRTAYHGISADKS